MPYGMFGDDRRGWYPKHHRVSGIIHGESRWVWQNLSVLMAIEVSVLHTHGGPIADILEVND